MMFLFVSQTASDHLHTLKEVFTIFLKKNICINFTKSKFCLHEITYLGIIINQEGIKADVSRVSDFQYTRPNTRKQLERLLGFLNWFRPFVIYLSKRILPITEKISKTVKFVWHAKDSRLVEEIIRDLKQQTLLSYPIKGENFVLQTDASEEAI